VHAKEVDSLKAQLAAVCRGERFILQVRDCESSRLLPNLVSKAPDSR
jgi:3-deoxy-D-arabino-heptulosonate 7-phosphate (DAHP) synthase class II